jgi:hypothetical protein
MLLELVHLQHEREVLREGLAAQVAGKAAASATLFSAIIKIGLETKNKNNKMLSRIALF